MEHRFDRLAASVGSAVNRRQALWRLGGGLIAAALASAGFTAEAAPDSLAKCCAFACLNLVVPPPEGQALAFCITECHRTGLVEGFPVVCP
jgi:hypothetical protein